VLQPIKSLTFTFGIVHIVRATKITNVCPVIPLVVVDGTRVPVVVGVDDPTWILIDYRIGSEEVSVGARGSPEVV